MQTHRHPVTLFLFILGVRYPCNECDYASTLPSDLVKHVRWVTWQLMNKDDHKHQRYGENVKNIETAINLPNMSQTAMDVL